MDELFKGRHFDREIITLCVRWYQVINDPTYADAILDRLVHNAHRIDLAGESLRRVRPSREKTADESLTR
jgi:hypothetical protein